MTNPFENRTSALSGPATDIIPVTTDDVTELNVVAIALYVESGGALSVLTARGGTRSINVTDNSILAVGIRRVNSTGTTASGIHALVIS